MHTPYAPPFEVDEPQGPPVGTLVCISGLNSGAYMFTGARLLLPRWRIIRFNTPGSAGVPLPLPFSVHRYAEHVQKHLGILQLHQDPVVVLGHSLGGYVAQELARLWPNTVTRLILVSTSRGQPDTTADMRAFEERLGQSFWGFSQHLEADPARALIPFFGPHFQVRHPAIYEHFLQNRAACLPTKAATLAQISAGAIFSSVRWLNRIHIPALVVHGTADILVSFTSGQKLAASLPQGRLLPLHDVGHFPPLEHPKFWEYVSQFCQGITLGEVVEPAPTFLTLLKRFWSIR
jgi:pimeloyl-ACP methyl ester carboxylesterase